MLQNAKMVKYYREKTRKNREYNKSIKLQKTIKAFGAMLRRRWVYFLSPYQKVRVMFSIWPITGSFLLMGVAVVPVRSP